MIFEADNLKKCLTISRFEGLDFIMARQEKWPLWGKRRGENPGRMLLQQESAAGRLNVGHNVDIGYYAQANRRT